MGLELHQGGFFTGPHLCLMVEDMTRRTHFISCLVAIHGLLLAPAILNGQGGFARAADGDEFSPWYFRMAKFYRRVDGTVPAGAVLFIGDSITQGMAVSAVTPLSVNLGIARDTSAGVLLRVRDYGSLSRARAAVLAIGVNDIVWRENSETISNVEKILDHIRAEHGTPVVLSAVLPIDDVLVADQPRRNADVDDLNMGLNALSAERDHVTWVDVTDALRDENGNLDDVYHTGDGVHLSAAGYAIWMPALRAALPDQSTSD